MKRKLILCLTATLILTLSACTSKPAEAPAAAENENVSSSESPEQDTEVSSDPAVSDLDNAEEVSEVIDLQTCTVDNITFSVDASWQPQSGMEGTFLLPDEACAYQLQGISPLGGYTPQEFFDSLIEVYENQYDIISADTTLSTYTSPDNVECCLGNVKMLMGDNFFDIDVLIAPSKNTVVTFAATCFKDNQDKVDIRKVSNTATFQIGDMDYITGNAFLANDGSELCLQLDGTFANYHYADDHDGERLTGTYEVYYGQSAIDQVAGMTEYGLTADELNGVLTAAQDGYVLNSDRNTAFLTESDSSSTSHHICLDTFYALILHNEQYITASNESSELGNTTLFIGYYIPELQMLDMTNANAANYAQFTYNGPADSSN